MEKQIQMMRSWGLFGFLGNQNPQPESKERKGGQEIIIKKAKHWTKTIFFLFPSSQ